MSSSNEQLQDHATESANCDVCGTECGYSDLSTYKLAGFGATKVCPDCVSKQGIDKIYRDANAMLTDIISIAISRDGQDSSEQRLEQIRRLLLLNIDS